MPPKSYAPLIADSAPSRNQPSAPPCSARASPTAAFAPCEKPFTSTLRCS
ncbi:hypothetical protein [Fodinicola feengrottensis]|nr:hypothetical protein [Fodinicola feengrottensis]